MVKLWLMPVLSIAAFGSTITYNYTGATFDRCGHGGCPANYSSDYDTASFTFTSPLAVNLSSANVTSNLLSWTIGDALGYSTFSSTTTGTPSVVFSTNGSGAIVGYQVQAQGQPGSDVAMFDPFIIGRGSGLPFTDAIDAITNPVTDFGFAASNDVPGTWTETLNGFQGGSTSSPVLLGGASPIGGVNGSIGAGGVDYYLFNWGGGAFSATASLTGASAADSFLFTGGIPGTCNAVSEILNSGDRFRGTISAPNLAAGEYCIGIQSSVLLDPNFSLTFNTPIGAVPEPSELILLCGGLGLIAVLRQRRRRGQQV